tara:strand:- start:658 stop:1137 length:480 start_codon:yes stop_codon:yes gene_type:complete
MATFTNKTFKDDDDYFTPKYVWEDIKDYIPKDKVIWEAFYGDGKSGSFLEELGFNVIHEEIDFFENNLGEIIVSNPPFSKIKQILEKLKELQKPFILIMPSSKINTQYFRKNFKDDIQIIIPKKRIAFIKNKKQTKSCNFDCFYYCYKINLPKDIVWLD